MFDNRRKEMKKKSLLTQLELLEILRSRHLSWSKDTDDAEIARFHLEIVDLI